MDKDFIIINGIIFNESVKISRCRIINLVYLEFSNNSRTTRLYFQPIHYNSKKPCIQSDYKKKLIKYS